ncbi:ATP-binding cassette, subfamily B [Clostridium amylolyticum]|uniref:ATP-binding cassette, subfamily B n=1 Tax=Clostridium amylolyticum TaxID=1121298 RepID=A0A1M6FHM1_9CLOT|nr:ABC transporter ATP-binding protein [Clostridium amylolyticum]SHI97177.1 ATP-binding cassette, subfamily B [Clostridium amylolyticum]
MHKSNLRKTIKTLKIGLKEIYKLHHWVLPVVMFDAFFKSIAPFINIYMSSRIINELLGEKDIGILKLLVTITIGINLIVHLVSAGFGHLKDMLMNITTENQQMKLNEKIISMDYEYVENPEVHNLRAKIGEAEKLNGGGIYALIEHTGDLTKSLVTVITSIVLVIDLFKINVTSNGHISFVNSAIFSYIFLILILAGTICSLKLKTKADKKLFGYFSKFMGINRIFCFYADQIYNYNIGKGVRLYNQKEIYSNEIDNFCKNAKKIFTSTGNMNAKYSGFEAFIASFLGGMVYAFVGLKAISGAITIGSIVKYAGSINQFMSGSREMLSSINSIVNNNQYIQLYIDFLNIKGEKHKGTLPVEKRDDDEYEIEFKNVSFKYPEADIYALKNVSIKLNIGERLAIVGMNGSGKTTFIKLLCRLYDPDEGEILLNGINIKKYDYEEYMKLFSIVFQEFKLFSFSLGQNVATSVNYDENVVKDVLYKVGLEERLNKMPKGIHTSLYKDFNENGVEISGGEAQKIALARALYRDSPIIILDEPTAALDPISEFDIYSKFNDIVGTKTAFYISHRLSSCRFCDEIAVFNKGKIIQKGSHYELLKDKKGKYYELWHSQAKYYNDNESA